MRVRAVHPSLLLAALCLGCQPAHLSPFPPQDVEALPTTLTVSQMQADLDTLFAGMARTHPVLAQRLPPQRADSVHRALRARITTDMSRRAFFRLIGTATAHFRDGHSGVLYPYPEFDRHAAAGGGVFPLRLATQDGHLVVQRDRADSLRIPRGARVRRISGLDADSLLAAFAQYARGETPVLRAEIIAEDFARWWWHLTDLPAPWSVVWERGTQRESTTVAAIALAALEGGDDGPSADRPSFRVAQDEVGVLDVPFFGGGEAFVSVLDSAVRVASARRLRGIVIDLRRNPGGSTDLVEALLSRISPRPCPLVSHVVEKRTERNRRWWWPRGAIGDTVTMDEGDVVVPRPLDERFPGDAVLLIGPFTYSAAIVMATAAQDCGAATLVGEPTGGFANQTAQIHFANLPHSQLRWFAPSRVVRRPRPADRDGPVTPDVFVPTVAGADDDAILAAAIGHLRRPR
jgi:hypothetical protein